MRILLRTLLLSLGLVKCLSVQSQALTLDQLIYVNTLEEISQDAYLTERGWKFEHVENQGDSIFEASWHYYKGTHELAAELLAIRKTDVRDMLVYSSYYRAPFDDIRSKVLDYHMEFLGSDHRGNALRNYYRGNRYDVKLSISTDEGKPIYHVRLQEHGLVKGYNVGESGEMIEQWVRLPPITKKQKAQAQAISDSLDQATKKLQAKRPRK